MYNSESTARQNQDLFIEPRAQMNSPKNAEAINQSCYVENNNSSTRGRLVAGTTSELLKRAADICLASMALLVFLPLLLLVAIAIRADSRGPVLYRQQRTGKHGATIRVYKLRSMYHAREVPFQQATKNDPRITRVGQYIRRTSLDELPQLLNVVAGSMSLVGPRPHPLALDAQFAKQIPSYLSRYEVKPGITGLAQIRGYRGETRQLSDMANRFKHDRLYIENWSLGLDLKILFTTAFKGWVQKNAY